MSEEITQAVGAPLERHVRPWQAGLTNPELLAAWKKKMPGVEPTERDLSAFALGTEVGFDHAQDLERQEWNRVHHVIAKHGLHPGRTDDSLVDVIDRALRRYPRPPGYCLRRWWTGL
jgi:hypothetical protein